MHENSIMEGVESATVTCSGERCFRGSNLIGDVSRDEEWMYFYFKHVQSLFDNIFFTRERKELKNLDFHERINNFSSIEFLPTTSRAKPIRPHCSRFFSRYLFTLHSSVEPAFASTCQE